MGVDPPPRCEEPALAAPLEAARHALDGRPVERCLIYCPDALGRVAIRTYPEAFARVRALAPLSVDLRSVLPTVTPVCFASMFTGAGPATHGIRRYEKPALPAITLFDALAAAGRRVAVVPVAGSSIDTIFRGRPVEYHTEPYDAEVGDRAVTVLQADGPEVVVVYNQEYDDVVHRTGPDAPEAVDALHRHVASFERLTDAAERAWSGFDRAVVFEPDHGIHLDLATGHGTHGTDLPEDLEVTHFYRFATARR
jgi:Type I phosphodiesterase / nucleotide pyrophosphatase